MGTMAFADDDNDVVFTYGEGGPVVEDGASLFIKGAEGNEIFGNIILHSGLYVENRSSSMVNLTIEVTVTKLPSGYLQLCFPSNCQNFPVGTTETTRGAMKAGAKCDLQSEWLKPSAYGEAEVTYRIKKYNYTSAKAFSFAGYGRSVSTKYTYDSTSTGIDGITAEADNAEYYDLSGRKVEQPTQGLYLKKAADGTCTKVWKK